MGDIYLCMWNGIIAECQAKQKCPGGFAYINKVLMSLVEEPKCEANIPSDVSSILI